MNHVQHDLYQHMLPRKHFYIISGYWIRYVTLNHPRDARQSNITQLTGTPLISGTPNKDTLLHRTLTDSYT